MNRTILALTGIAMVALDHSGAWAQATTTCPPAVAPTTTAQPATAGTATPVGTNATACPAGAFPGSTISNSAPTAAPAGVRPITVDEALEIGFRNNPGLRIAVDVLNRSRAVVSEARAAFNPTFNATVTYLRQPGSTVTFPGQAGQPATEIVTTQAANTTVGVNAFLPLDINRSLAFSGQITEYQFRIQYLNLLATSETLIQNIKVAYYDLLRACGQQDTAQAAVDVSRVRLDNTRARFEAGTVPKFDLTTAEVDLANLEQQLIQQETRVEQVRGVLNRVLGIDLNTPTQVVQSAPPAMGAPVDIPAAVQTAYQHRPEVQAGQEAISLNETSVKLQRTGYLPNLGVSGGLNYTAETSGLSSNSLNWQAALTLNIPIWTGGVTRARVRQAQADVANAVDTLEQTRLAVALDVRAAALNIDEAVRRRQSTAAAVILAEEALRLANVRYEAGIATLVEVTNAESQLTQARFNNVNALYDFATAQAQLQRATACQPEIDRLTLLAPVKAAP
ncbi:MAG: TolC family protein [Armatimonadota bacterium]|nr:TolC family protein [bacterium]